MVYYKLINIHPVSVFTIASRRGRQGFSGKEVAAVNVDDDGDSEPLTLRALILMRLGGRALYPRDRHARHHGGV